jgi:hypothetical protein
LYVNRTTTTTALLETDISLGERRFLLFIASMQKNGNGESAKPTYFTISYFMTLSAFLLASSQRSIGYAALLFLPFLFALLLTMEILFCTLLFW